jgi:hypothetical protein
MKKYDKMNKQKEKIKISECIWSIKILKSTNHINPNSDN